MAKMLKLLLPLAFSALLAGAAGAEDEVGETRAIDARVVNIRLDGQLDLKVKQGATPSLTVYAERRWLPNILTEQSGDTLRIDTEVSGFHFFNRPKLRAELTLPALHAAIFSGAVAGTIVGFSGDALRLALNGAGKLDLEGQYRRVDARLSGAGKLNLNAGNSDKLEIDLSGAGSVVLVGRSKTLKASLSGAGKMDARELAAESASLDLSGAGKATLFASQDANLRLSGASLVTVLGKPVRRNVDTSGVSKVVWE